MPERDPAAKTTVSQILAAHAAAQIAAARRYDQASHNPDPAPAKPACASFVASWAIGVLCIGSKTPAAG